MESPNLLPALVGVIGSIGVGLIAIAGAMFLKIFRGPAEQHSDLMTEIRDQREDHTELSENVAVLANEVRHLAENVKNLGEEVKGLWRGANGTRARGS